MKIIKKKIKKIKKIKLTNEEEECITEYEKLLKKILQEFHTLYLIKTKQEFLNIMKEQGISIQIDKNAINKNIRGKRRVTKRITKTERHAVKTEANENRNKDEEDDLSSVDHDKKILAKFIKEQKKEIDEFINVKKPTNAPKPNGAK